MTPQQRKQKQMDFMDSHWSLIITNSYSHIGQTGYLQIYVDEKFNLVKGSVKFIPGEFNTDDYMAAGPMEEPIHPTNVKEAFWIYYSIIWLENRTRWDVKQLGLAASSIL